MKRKIISASLLPFLALTTYGAYTVTERLGISDGIDNIQSRDTSFNNEEVAIEGLRFVSRGFYLGDSEAETELAVEGSKAFDYDIEYDEYDLQIDYSVPGIHTITATIKDWDGVVIGTMKANKIIFENTFYQADEIWGWYEEDSQYEYNGTPRPVKIKDGVTVPSGFSHSWPYVADGDEIQPWPTEGGLEGKELSIYYQGSETGGEKALVLYDRRYNINISKVTINVSYPNTLIFADQLPYKHEFTYKGDLDVEQVRKAPFKYRLDNKATGNQSLDAPLIDGKAKKQYIADVILSNSSNFSNVPRTVSTVSVIDRMDKGEVAYDGNDHMAEAKAIADKISVPGVTVFHQYKNSNGDVVTEMIKGGVYTIEATYSYNGAEPIIDTTTFTIKKGTYEATEQKGMLEYNGSEQTLGVDFSQLPAGVKIKAGSSIEVKGKDVGTYTATIQMDGGETYEDFGVKVTLEVKQAVIPSITLNNKEVFYNGNTHAVAIEEILPDEVKVTYSYS
ncbi:MAG: hypothetical protein LBI73_06015, partial [Myroides sp.]|nr:hypothetical protein [Myroides sp.]